MKIANSSHRASPPPVSDGGRTIGSPIDDPVLCLVERGAIDADPPRVGDCHGVRLGQIDVFKFEGAGLRRVDRKPAHIEADGMTDYLVSIPLRARIDFAQAGLSGCIQPGTFTLLSTASPFTVSASGEDCSDVFSALHVRVSGAVLRQRLPCIDEFCDQSIRLKSGAGIIMQRMCELAIAEGRSLSYSEARQFGSMLVDSVVNAMAQAPELLSLPIHSSRASHLRIWRQAKAHIELNLPLSSLDTESVAAHCRVPKGYLQKIFAEFGESVTVTIREMRLQQCRAALRNPALRARPISQIAMHWGFNDLPYFCRAYRTRFDCTPSKDREPI